MEKKRLVGLEIVGVFVILCSLVALIGRGWIYNIQAEETEDIETINLIKEEDIVKKTVLEDIKGFENIDDAEISFEKIELKGNKAIVDIYINWDSSGGKGLGVGYQYNLVKEDKQWIILSRERTIVE